jgi:hypothetical protein
MSDPSTSQPSGPALTKEQEAAMATSDPPPEAWGQQPAPPAYTPGVAYVPGTAQPVAYVPGSAQPITLMVSFSVLNKKNLVASDYLFKLVLKIYVNKVTTI